MVEGDDMEIIVYGSQYGTTEQYAKELGNRTGILVKSYAEAGALDRYDTIIYIGALYAGGVLGMKKTLRMIKHPERKAIAVATVGLADPSDPVNTMTIREGMRKQLTEEVFSHVGLYHLRGGIDYAKLSPKHKLMMEILYRKAIHLPEEKKTAEVKAMIETYGRQVSFVDFSMLDPLIRWIQMSRNISGLCLVRPSLKYAEQIAKFRQEILENNDDYAFSGCSGLEEVNDIQEWFNFEERLKEKYGDGYVPSDVFLAVRQRDDKLIGIIDYRHPLSDFLLQYGGGIGYTVRPSERQKGYATEMLRLVLNYCRECGKTRILVCCDKANDASRRTIIRNGGVLQNEVDDPAGISQSGVIQRYWICLDNG